MPQLLVLNGNHLVSWSNYMLLEVPLFSVEPLKSIIEFHLKILDS